MNAKRVAAAEGVILAALKTRQTAAGIAVALESACLLQSPESASELAALRGRVAAAAGLDDDRLALIRKRRTHCEAVQFEAEDERPLHNWGPSDHPGREMCQRCTTMREWAEEPDTDEGVLLAVVDRLRAQVAELEAERASIVAERDAQIIAWLGKKAHEYGVSNRESRAKAEAVWRMADKLSRGAVRPPASHKATAGELAEQRHLMDPLDHALEALAPRTTSEEVRPQVQKLRNLLAGQRAATGALPTTTIETSGSAL